MQSQLVNSLNSFLSARVWSVDGWVYSIKYLLYGMSLSLSLNLSP